MVRSVNGCGHRAPCSNRSFARAPLYSTLLCTISFCFVTSKLYFPLTQSMFALNHAPTCPATPSLLSIAHLHSHLLPSPCIYTSDSSLHSICTSFLHLFLSCGVLATFFSHCLAACVVCRCRYAYARGRCTYVYLYTFYCFTGISQGSVIRSFVTRPSRNLYAKCIRGDSSVRAMGETA